MGVGVGAGAYLRVGVGGRSRGDDPSVWLR